jgi:hypothetical protein
MKTANDEEFIAAYLARMEEYLRECVEEKYITERVYVEANKFWTIFHGRYGLDLDCAPTNGGVLFALDDGVNHCEFELVLSDERFGKMSWEFFYRDRSDNEMHGCDFDPFKVGQLGDVDGDIESFEDVEKYIKRYSGCLSSG